ncbi:MAG TPA: hypothetical protein VKT29_08405 [Terriglobales bacterium]|nr:hypothetical protein [Terriglobales bacterium]
MRVTAKAICLSLLVLLASATVAQVPVAHDGELALQFPHIGRNGASSWFVDYVDYSGEPAFRILVHHYHAWCYGYVYISANRVAYEPVFTPSLKDGFSVSRRSLSNVAPRFSGIEFEIGGKAEKFAFISGPSSPHMPRGLLTGRDQLLTFIQLAITNFQSARSQMARVLVGSQKTFSAEAAGESPPRVSNPTISVLLPAGAAQDAVVDAGTSDLRVLGFAVQNSPIRLGWVNGRRLLLRFVAPNVAEFQSTVVPLAGDLTAVQVTLQTDIVRPQIEFSVRRPRVRFAMLPLETHDATYTLRGTLIGYGDVQAVRLLGVRGAIQRNADGSTSFELPNVPMEVGKNVLTGSVYTAEGVREPFEANVTRIRRLDMAYIQEAMHVLSRARLLELINERGVDFQLDDLNEKVLRAAGADDALLLAISKAEHAVP